MTQAYNLALLANAVDTSGKLNASTNLSGTIPDANLANSGVTAGTYTTATVTVDAKGRVTAASSGSGGGVTSLNGQTGAITNTTFNAIGAYCVSARMNGAQATTNLGDTCAGTQLYNQSSGNSWGCNSLVRNGYGYSLSNFGRTGTYRAIGCSSKNGDPDDCGNYSASQNLWVRVS